MMLKLRLDFLVATVAMGRWVFRQALTEPYLKQLAKQGGTVSINLSIRQFADEHLIEFLSDLLMDTDFPAHA